MPLFDPYKRDRFGNLIDFTPNNNPHHSFIADIGEFLDPTSHILKAIGAEDYSPHKFLKPAADAINEGLSYIVKPLNRFLTSIDPLKSTLDKNIAPLRAWNDFLENKPGDALAIIAGTIFSGGAAASALGAAGAAGAGAAGAGAAGAAGGLGTLGAAGAAGAGAAGAAGAAGTAAGLGTLGVAGTAAATTAITPAFASLAGTTAAGLGASGAAAGLGTLGAAGTAAATTAITPALISTAGGTLGSLGAGAAASGLGTLGAAGTQAATTAITPALQSLGTAQVAPSTLSQILDAADKVQGMYSRLNSLRELDNPGGSAEFKNNRDSTISLQATPLPPQPQQSFESIGTSSPFNPAQPKMSPISTGLFSTNSVDTLLGKKNHIPYPNSPVSEKVLSYSVDPVQKVLDDKKGEEKGEISDSLSEVLGNITPFIPQKLHVQSRGNMSIPNMNTTFEELFAPKENTLPGDKFKAYSKKFNPYRSSANKGKLIDTSILSRSFI